MSDDAPRAENHWWWRPGWRPGRVFYTWHLTFDEQPEVHELAAVYRSALAPLGGWDPVPDAWLHLTMQGVGFVDEVPAGDVRAIVEHAERTLSAVAPFDLVLGRPTFTPEAIRWDPDSPGPAKVRTAVRDAIRRRLSDVPEQADGFTPHVTIAYSNSDGPAAPALEAIAGVPALHATARITHAELIALNRDNRMYEWETYARVPLGGS